MILGKGYLLDIKLVQSSRCFLPKPHPSQPPRILYLQQNPQKTILFHPYIYPPFIISKSQINHIDDFHEKIMIKVFYCGSRLIKLLMANQRKQFVSRLQKISELNQQLSHLNQKYHNLTNYPRKLWLNHIATRKITLANECPSTDQHGQILVINRTHLHPDTQKHSQRQLEDNKPSDNVSTSENSPTKVREYNHRSYHSRRKHSLNDSYIKTGDIPIASSMHYHTKSTFSNSTSIQTGKGIENGATQINKNRPHKNGRRQSRDNLGATPIAEQTISKIEELLVFDKFARPQSSNAKRQAYYFKSVQQISLRNNEEEKSAKLSMRRQVNKAYSNKTFVPPPKLTAKSYFLCEVKENQLKAIAMFNSKNSQEVASLTKIMTCIMVLETSDRLKLVLEEEEVTIGKFQTKIGGTSAKLQQGQVYTVRQLLYGLMLPSGNDASLALAVWCGRQLLIKDNEDLEKTIAMKNTETSLNTFTKNQCYSRFIKEMNVKAKTLNMTKTHYSNSHGLANIHNRSTAYDIAVLSAYCMKNAAFREIVSCKRYECCVKYSLALPSQADEENCNTEMSESDSYSVDNEELSDEESESQHSLNTLTRQEIRLKPCKSTRTSTKTNSEPSSNLVIWQNTHKLLHKKKEYLGIKTGITSHAGACLSSCLFIDGRTFLIVVLGCPRLHLRFKETQALKTWLCKQEQLTRPTKKKSTQKSKEDNEQSDSDVTVPGNPT